jgi:hypothetical protein
MLACKGRERAPTRCYWRGSTKLLATNAGSSRFIGMFSNSGMVFPFVGVGAA